jgi:uncharacterized membrane protein YbhN (UPF0104 family)
MKIMFRLLTMFGPMILRSRAKRSPSLKAWSGYAFSSIAAGIGVLFLLAALFTWTYQAYGLDAAFLSIAVSLFLIAIAVAAWARLVDYRKQKKIEDQRPDSEDIPDLSDDPLAEYIPENILEHPASRRILARVNEQPLTSSAAAVGLGVVLSRQILNDTEAT